MAAVYLDNDVAIRLVQLMHETSGHVVRHTRDEGMADAPDYAQLRLASQRGWVFVTHNKRDFRLLHGAWRHWSVVWGVSPAHAGILIVEQVPPDHLPEIAWALREILTGERDIRNELYEWTRQHGWTRKTMVV